MGNCQENVPINFFETEQTILDNAIEFVERNKDITNDSILQLQLVIKNYKKVLKQTNKLLKVSDTQQNDLKKIQNNLRNLLDNAKQGFLSFSQDLLINKEYSAECERILQQKISNKRLSDIVFSDDIEKKNYFDDVINRIFSVNDVTLFNVWFKLLPHEIRYNNKYLNLEYVVIELDNNTNTPNVLMVIITDISENRELEIKMEEEQNILKMVVSCVTNYNILTQMFKEYRAFCSNVKDVIFQTNSSLDTIVNTILREVHTFKGNFGQLNFFNTATLLHEFETEIYKYKETCNKDSLEKTKSFFLSFPIQEWLDKDISILKNIIGTDFFEKESVDSIKTKLIEIEDKISILLPIEKSKDILTEIRKLRYEPFINILKPYIEYSKRLAERVSKIVEVSIYSDVNIMVDMQVYCDFSRSLVHLFKNSIDHGIEEPEERFKKGKDYTAKIKCSVYRNENFIVLNICDDGRGIDIGKIKKIAIEKNIYNENDIQNIDEKEILLLIFRENFSTSIEVTDISGRGVGLNVIKTILDKIGGKVEVKTQKDLGSEFILYIPLLK